MAAEAAAPALAVAESASGEAAEDSILAAAAGVSAAYTWAAVGDASAACGLADSVLAACGSGACTSAGIAISLGFPAVPFIAEPGDSMSRARSRT